MFRRGSLQLIPLRNVEQVADTRCTSPCDISPVNAEVETSIRHDISSLGAGITLQLRQSEVLLEFTSLILTEQL